MRKFSYCFDMYDNPIYDGDILESVNYGTQLKVKYNYEEGVFMGDYHPTENRPYGYGVTNIKFLDLKRYFIIDGDNSNKLKCKSCKYQSDVLYWRGYNCVGDGKFLACDEFEWD